MKSRNKRVHFVGVNLSACEPNVPAILNKKSLVESMVSFNLWNCIVESPKTSEYKFYKRTLEESCWKFGSVQEIKDENAPAKLEQRNHMRAKTGKASQTMFEKIGPSLAIKHLNTSDPSCSPHVSLVTASREFPNCDVPSNWPCSSSHIVQNLDSKNSSIHNVTPSFPGTGSSIPLRVDSIKSGMQNEHGEIFSIKRRKLCELTAKALSLSLDDFLSLGSDAIPKLLQRLAIEKNDCSSSRLSTVKSNTKHSNCDDPDSDNYTGKMLEHPRPKKLYHNLLLDDSGLNFTYHNEIGSTEFQSKDAERMVLFSPINNYQTIVRSDLVSPNPCTWNTEELNEGRRKAHQMLCNTSDSALLGVSAPLYMTRNTLHGAATLAEPVHSRRLEYYTVVDVPSDLVLLDSKGDPYFQWHSPNQPVMKDATSKTVHPKRLRCYNLEDVPSDYVLLDSNVVPDFQRNSLKWPIFEDDTYNVEETAGKEIIDPLDILDSGSWWGRLRLDASYENEASVDALVPKTSTANIRPESFIRWFYEFGVRATSCFPFDIPFHSEKFSSQPMSFGEIASYDFNSIYSSLSPQRRHILDDGHYPEIVSHDFGSCCNVWSPRKEYILEADHFSHNSLSRYFAQNWPFHFQQESIDLIRGHDVNNTASFTRSSSSYMSRGLLLSKQNYLCLPEMNMNLNRPLALGSSSEFLRSNDVDSAHKGSWQTNW